MPHFAIEYSANLEPEVDVQGLCHAVRIAAIETGLFPMPGIRVRAYRADHFSIANGDSQHAFVDISIRLREGREQAAKEAATEHVFAAAKTFLAPQLSSRSLALSIEMRDIDASVSPKTGNTREYLGSN